MNSSVEKLISHVILILVEKEKGQINPYLKVRIEGGKYVLNSQFVNYSFGGLHSVFSKVFNKYDFSSRKVENVLVLGFGAGSVASLLRKEGQLTCPITGVEGDKVVIKLTKKYFDPEQYSPLELIHGDAFEYIMNTKNRYDIIIVDIFIEDNVPERFMKSDFIQKLNDVLSNDGILFYNKMVNTSNQKKEVEKLYSLCTEILGDVRVEKIHAKGKDNWMFVYDRFHGNINPFILRRYKVIPIRSFQSQLRPAIGM